MKVTRLEIFGFKSFMERIILPLEGGVTGVVGPNGCGKSNIVDALRWVLGETRASNLRGGVLEDVIFNGTDKLRPLGLAEVTITLRATSQDFFADLVSPSLEADLIAKLDLPPAPVDEPQGEAVENQNAAPSAEQSGGEQKELVDVRPKLTIIEGRLGQNEAAEVEAKAQLASEIQATADAPTEQSEVVAQTEAEATEENPQQDITMLARFSWLKSVSEVQVTRRLYRSGESEYFINRVACRLKDLKDFFRAVGIGARAYTIVAQGEVTRIISAKPEERRLILEEAAGVLGFRDKISAASRRLDETTANILRLDDVITEVTRQVNSLRVQASRARNRQTLKEQITALDRSLIRDAFYEQEEKRVIARKNLDETVQKEDALVTAFERARALEEEARNELASIDAEGDDIRRKVDSIRDELDRRAQNRNRFTLRLNEIRAFSLSKATEIKRLEEQTRTFAQRDVESQNEVAQLTVKERELAEQLGGVSHDSSQELREIAQHRDMLRGKLREKEQALREVRDRLISAQSSIRALEEQIVASSPLNQLKQSTGTKDLETLRTISADAKLFAEGLSVPAKYAKAVQSYLAERAKFIISSEPEKIAHYFVDQIASGQAKGAGIGVFRAGALTEQEGGRTEAQGQSAASLPKILDHVVIEPTYGLAAHTVFKDVYVAETLAQAFEFFSVEPALLRERADAKVVTVDGDIVTAVSFFSLRHEGGLIQLKRRLEDLNESQVQVQIAHDELAAQRETLQAEIRAAEEQHALILRESQERQARARDLNNQLGNVRGRLHAAQRLTQQIVQDSARVVRQIEEAKAKIEALAADEARVIEESQQLNTDEDEALQERLAILREEYTEIEQRRRSGRNALSDTARGVEEARRAVDKVKSDTARFNLDVQRMTIEINNIMQRGQEEHGEETLKALLAEDGTPHRLTPEVRQESHTELVRLKAKMAREGEVDPTSIQRFDEESARLDDLQKQKKDLETAGDTLKRTIARLTETSEKRFIATFNAVQSNFSRLVPKLFGGGKGSLELTDPAHPLDSGVEIMTRPPGKKPKSIELLSGGEKALCATALIIAMFLERPSPLCVLDEVDAPLDEANLMRFLGLVKEMSTKTQFLLITHNKQSMAVSDTLVGVTQEEPGASKLIAVSLQEAFSHVA
jgi:chromosome segregation protein